MKATDCMENSMGIYGASVVTTTAAQSGNWVAIEFITAGAFSVFTGQDMTGFTGVTFPAGTRILGRISAFTLSSGSVVAYRGVIA